MWPEGVAVVKFPSGRAVHARSLRRQSAPDPAPEFGIYLSARVTDEPDWPCEQIRWRDFGLPADRTACVDTLRLGLGRADAERVEVACSGGRGRTGTALAVMAILEGIDPADAVAWVRRHHHPRAIETPWQRRWIRRFQPPSSAG